MHSLDNNYGSFFSFFSLVLVKVGRIIKRDRWKPFGVNLSFVKMGSELRIESLYALNPYQF